MASPRFLDIPAPLGGLSEGQSYTDQPPLTSRSLINVWPIDPKTKRMRLSARPGLNKFNNTPIEASQPVRRIVEIAYHNPAQTTYTATATAAHAAAWDKTLDSKLPSYDCVSDQQGNVFALDGRATVRKFNQDGEEVDRFTVTMEDEAGQCRALAVDEYGTVYIGITDGGSVTRARVWAYAPVQVGNLVSGDQPAYTQRWVITFKDGKDAKVRGHCQALVYKSGSLYGLYNNDDTQRSYVMRHDNLVSAAPDVGIEFEVPYPARGLDVSKSGEIGVTWEAFAERYVDPRAPECLKTPYPRSGEPGHKGLWTPDDIYAKGSRIWSWYDAENIDGLGNDTLLDGDEIAEWQDISGNARHLRKTGTAGQSGPVYRTDGLAHRPSVFFDENATNITVLTSSANPTLAYGQRKLQRTVVPTWDSTTPTTGASGGRFFLMMCVRPTRITAPVTGPDCILFQDLNGGNDLRILSNASTAAASSPGTMCVHTTGTNNTGSYDNQANASVLGIDYKYTTANATFARINGTASAGYTAPACDSTDKTWIGVTSGAVNRYHGDICEMICFAQDVTAASVPAKINEAPPLTSDEKERVEGYMAWRRGIPFVLPGGHAYDFSSAPPRRSGTASEASWRAVLVSLTAGLGKWSSSGDLVWAYDDATATGGFGYGLKFLSSGALVTVGPENGAGITIRRITDNGSSASFAGGTTWTAGFGAGRDFLYKWPHLAIDAEDSIYLPVYSSGMVTPETARIYKSDGTLFRTINSLTGDPQTHAIALGPVKSYYGDVTLSGSPISPALYIYLATNQATGTPATDKVLHKVNIVGAVQNSEPARLIQRIAFAGGNIKTFDDTTVSSAIGTYDTETNHISAVAAFGSVWITDGSRYSVYTPLKADGTSSFDTWKSTSGGQIPSGCRLLALWQGRAVLAGDPTDPTALYMSKIGDFRNWDFVPAVPTADQAYSSQLAGGAGRIPEPITTLIPWADDLLIVGCDRSVYVIAGNPTNGGTVQSVTGEKTGIAFGDSWAKSPQAVFFAGTQGGIYMLRPGTALVNLTEGVLDQEFKDISLEDFQPLLVWDHEYDGLHVFYIRRPGSSSNARPTHYFWSARTKGWFPMEIGGQAQGVGLWPSAVLVADGDLPQDRKLLIGCRDGHIRLFHPDVDSDDSFEVEWSFLVGPLAPRNATGKWMFARPIFVLAPDKSGAQTRFYVSDNPDLLGESVGSYKIPPGRSNSIPLRASAYHVWTQIYGDGRFSYENGKLEYHIYNQAVAP